MSPIEIFNDAHLHLDFFKSDGFESQHYDRKEVRVESKSQKTEIKEEINSCISGFANTNVHGGVLVLGINNSGKVVGLNHVNEKDLNEILQSKDVHLKNHYTKTQHVKVIDSEGKANYIMCLYTSFTSDAICETVESSPKAWKRDGPRCQILNDFEKEQLKRDKKVVLFENSVCAPYSEQDIAIEIFNEFKKYFVESRDARFDMSMKEILFQAGAVTKTEDGKFYFTNAGFLFFASNPRSKLASNFIRFLRFDCDIKDFNNPGAANFDKDFDGPLPSLIRKTRNFIKEFAFFKSYKVRKEDGGFIDELEYPYLAVDEAIVNAVAHRDYAINSPILCIAYRDAFTVRSPGPFPQDVPKEFSLGNFKLESLPRNSKIVDWLRLMKDEQGAEFLRSLSEGTKVMKLEMERLNLPSPEYKVTNTTTVILKNNYEEREKKYQLFPTIDSTEFSNLFKIIFSHSSILESDHHSLKGILLTSFKDTLYNNGWFIDKFSHSRLIAHKKGHFFSTTSELDKLIRIYQAFSFQIKGYGKNYFLVVDSKTEVKNIQSVSSLPSNELIPLNEKKAIALVNNKWETCKIKEVSDDSCKVFLFDYDDEVEVIKSNVIPELSKYDIDKVLQLHNIKYDLSKKIKETSLASQTNATKSRIDIINNIILSLIDDKIFPIKIKDSFFTILTNGEKLKTTNSKSILEAIEPLTVFHDIAEPQVEFNHSHKNADILSGLTRFGSYDHKPKTIEIIPICTKDLETNMESLLNRITIGKYKYLGSEKTFGVKFKYSSINTVNHISEIDTKCKSVIHNNRDWIGNKNLDKLFLIFIPENTYPITDKNSPYYSIKEFLLENGLPCQMVDYGTILNPDWKDLNLALNIIAKCGKSPWVLPGGMTDVDFFIGLSYTLNADFKYSHKLMGFANVFNQYGRWQFYKGDAIFEFNDRHKYFQALIKSTLSALPLSETPSIHFHYSSKFSNEDIRIITNAANQVRPHGHYSFVWINTDHSIRLFDSSPHSDGSLNRGSYVVTSKNQFYLSTTGYNIYRKTLGTPKMLEVNIRTEPHIYSQPLDLKLYASQLLSLTKLNYASTQALTGEPITIKYAKEIARLTSMFIERRGVFKLHPVLETTPWFI